MLKKTIRVNTKDNEWTNTVIEYRLFGILIHKRIMYSFNRDLDCVYNF